VFLYTSNKRSEKETKKAIILTPISKIRIKHLGINFKKGGEGFGYWKLKSTAESNQRQPKLMEKHLTLIGIAIYKAIYRSNTISTKLPAALFCRSGKANPEIHMKLLEVPNSQNNTEKEWSWMTHIS
jgi:hypothetical protein